MTVEAATPARTPYDEWRDRRWRVVGKPVFVSSGDPRETLRSIDPHIRLTSGSVPDARSVSFVEWRAPEAVALLALTTWLGALFLIGSGPEPWRATRWAWGWAWLLTGPLGSVAYLLLGGPMGIARPTNPARRLTGGWAFLLFGVLLGGVWSS